jgi:hypothetical protein
LSLPQGFFIFIAPSFVLGVFYWRKMLEPLNKENKERVKVVTLLCREQLDYLDQLGKDSLFHKGKKLSRAQILSGLVDILMKAGICVTDLRESAGELSTQLLKALQDKTISFRAQES